MAKYEITAELNLKKIIAEAREVAQALNEFADNLEQIEKKYADPQERREE
jgi:NTP pyrophosphatase (non-canonical NTP hydrolase)